MKIGDFVKEHKFEIAVVLLFIFAWTLRVNVDGLFLSHPGNIKAADPMYHSLAAQVIVDEGVYGNLPYYLAQGWENMIDPNPPLNYIITAWLTKISGLPVWNVMYLLITLFEAFGVILLFLLANRIFHSKEVGLIAAAAYVIPFGLSEWWYGMYIGLWNNVGGFFFFFASLWLAYEYWKSPSRWKIFALSLTVTGTWLIHVAELFMTAFFAGIVALRLLFYVKTWKEKIIQALLFGVIPLISFILFYPRFNELSGFLTAGAAEGSGGGFIGWFWPQLSGLPFYSSLGDFPWWLLIIAGFGVAQVLLNWKKYIPFIIGETYLFIHLFVLPWFLSAYYFFVRQRMALPFILAPLVAYGAYYFIIKPLSNLTKVREIVYVTIMIVFLIAMAWPQYLAVTPLKHNQHLPIEKYNALLWLQDNTDPKAEVFFLTGYYQMSDSYAKRIAFDLDLPDFVGVLNEFAQSNGTILKTEFNRVGSAGNTEMHMLALDEGNFFNYGLGSKRSGTQNITDFDYIIMADFQLGDTPVVQAYNQIMANHLIEQYSYRLAYNQDGIRILEASDEA